MTEPPLIEQTGLRIIHRVCDRCEKLFELYASGPPTERRYWLATELFVAMHGGQDHCDGGDITYAMVQ